MVYTFLVSNQEITFVTDRSDVAFFCSYIIGKGEVESIDEQGEQVGSMCLDDYDTDYVKSKLGGATIREFQKHNRDAIIECLDSFAYVSKLERANYESKSKEQKTIERQEHEMLNPKWVSAALSFSKII